MGLMNIPNPIRTGRIGRQVFAQSEYSKPKTGEYYILDWVGTKGGIVGELMGCQYLKYEDGSHFFSYLAPASWGAVTAIICVSDEALTNGAVMIFEMIED